MLKGVKKIAQFASEVVLHLFTFQMPA